MPRTRPFVLVLMMALTGCNAALSERSGMPMFEQGAGAKTAFDMGVPQNGPTAPVDSAYAGVLGGSNTYTGGTTISGGTFKSGSGTLSMTGGVTDSLSANGVVTLAAVQATAMTTDADQQRLVIYNATLGMVVPDIGQTLATIQKQTKALGGYMQEIAGAGITVRVPVVKFEEAMSGFEKLGEVTQRRIKADDITEQMHDVKIRLENAEVVRQRLLGLVEKSTKVEDTLKIEQELMRVSETIELYKGKIKFLSSQASFSTVRVELNSPLPQKQVVAQLPFAWVRALADGAVAGNAEAAPDTSRWERRGIKFDLPGSYIRYFERDYRTEAMSATGTTLKLQRQDNYDGGDLGFWSKLAQRALVENRGISIDKEYDFTLNNKVPARAILGVKEVGNKKTAYLLVLVTGKRYVYTFEAWGDRDELLKDLPGLEAAAKSMDVAK